MKMNLLFLLYSDYNYFVIISFANIYKGLTN